MDDEANPHQEHIVKNKYIRFNPTINAGHILTASTVLMASVMAWAQLRSDVSLLIEENKNRKIETESIRADLYTKMADNQSEFRVEVHQIHIDIASGFNRLDDKLERKQDKK